VIWMMMTSETFNSEVRLSLPPLGTAMELVESGLVESGWVGLGWVELFAMHYIQTKVVFDECFRAIY